MRKQSAKASLSSVPQLIKISLTEIQVDEANPIFELQNRLRHLPQAVPSLNETALDLLTLVQPLQVIKYEKDDDSGRTSFKLIGGFRTYQLLLEQRSMKALVWALLHPQQDAANEALLAAMDVVVKVLQRPDDLDLGLLAKALHDDKELRSIVENLVPISTDEKLSLILGMSRSSLNRNIQSIRKLTDQNERDTKIEEGIDLDIDEESVK